MLYINEKNTTTLQNYENSKKLKIKQKDFFFHFLKNFKNVQELWIKAILFDKNYFLVPLSTKLQNLNFNTFNNFYCINETIKSTKSKISFVLQIKKGSFLGTISSNLPASEKIIYINKIDYVKCKSHKVLSKAIINLLDYFRRTYHVNNFCISIKKIVCQRKFF